MAYTIKKTLKNTVKKPEDLYQQQKNNFKKSVFSWLIVEHQLMYKKFVRKNFSTCESLVCVCEEDVGRTIREMCDDHVL